MMKSTNGRGGREGGIKGRRILYWAGFVMKNKLFVFSQFRSNACACLYVHIQCHTGAGSGFPA